MTLQSVIDGLLATGEDRERLSGALALLSGDEIPCERHTAAIAVRRVLSCAWAPSRMERLREATRPLPSIKVVRYRIGGIILYGVSDGNHRTELARERGQRTIRAEIGCEWNCDPQEYVIAGTTLWKIEDRRLRLRSEMGEVSDELRALLASLGVREYDNAFRPGEREASA